MDRSNQQFQESTSDRAAHWVARLRSDACTEQDRQEFALWLAANPRHPQSMDTMLDLWDDLGALKLLPQPLPQQQRQARAISRRRWLGASVALAASVLLAVMLTPQLGWQSNEQQLQTRQGEQLAVTLADGSRITLNTNSSVRVSLQAGQRLLELTQGEAFFEVAKDPQRPFIVAAGDAEVRALGTAFNIYVHDGESNITVTEGVIRVTELNAPTGRAPDSALLYRDQAITGSAGGLAAPTVSNSNVSLAWREGNIVAEAMPLSSLVKELSRYHARQIIIADPVLAQTTISGVFPLQDPDTILRALEHSLGIQSVALNDGSIQLLRAPL